MNIGCGSVQEDQLRAKIARLVFDKSSRRSYAVRGNRFVAVPTRPLHSGCLSFRSPPPLLKASFVDTLWFVYSTALSILTPLATAAPQIYSSPPLPTPPLAKRCSSSRRRLPNAAGLWYRL
ncbi:hypothetical protein ACOSQ2_003942 [Xanthoceras sorbifolium]